MVSHPQLEEWKRENCIWAQTTVGGDVAASLPFSPDTAVHFGSITPLSTLIFSPMQQELDSTRDMADSAVELLEPEALLGHCSTRTS